LADVLSALSSGPSQANGSGVPPTADAAEAGEGASSSWLPDLSFALPGMPGLSGRLINALAVAVVFVIVTMTPLQSIAERFLCKGGRSLRIPYLGAMISAGTISLLAKSLAAGAITQAFVAPCNTE
jgi:hypothetical protein